MKSLTLLGLLLLGFLFNDAKCSKVCPLSKETMDVVIHVHALADQLDKCMLNIEVHLYDETLDYKSKIEVLYDQVLHYDMISLEHKVHPCLDTAEEIAATVERARKDTQRALNYCKDVLDIVHTEVISNRLSNLNKFTV